MPWSITSYHLTGTSLCCIVLDTIHIDLYSSRIVVSVVPLPDTLVLELREMVHVSIVLTFNPINVPQNGNKQLMFL